MRRRGFAIGSLALALSAAQAAAPHSTQEVEAVRDARATALVTLDGEHPWSFDGDLAAWERRRERLRRQVLVAAGLWPLPERAMPSSIVTGEIDRSDYVVRKLALETRPGLWLTANLYLPVVHEGRMPAVLAPHGHWRDGRMHRASDQEVEAELASGAERDASAARFPLQAFCAGLARLGCVVLHYDMIGYGEFHQLSHDSEFVDLQSILWGESHLGLQTWNSLAALDWLASLPEVDSARIGVAGASGGGTQTFLLCAIDERPAAAFPAVMVSSNMQGGCVCENAPHLRVGTTNVELAALFAPRPLGLSGANDWTIDVQTKALPALQQIWSLFGTPERVQAHCWPQYGHNFNLHTREAVYACFDEHLALKATKHQLLEAPLVPIEPADLAVFAGADPSASGGARREELLTSLRADSAARAAALMPSTHEDFDRFRATVGGALEVLVHTSLGEVAPVVARELGAKDGRRELALSAADGRGEIAATLLVPREPNGVACVAVSSSGRASFLEGSTPEGAAVQDALAHGVTVLLPEVLLGGAEARGEATALPTDAERHSRYAGYTLAYNRCLLAERARDVLTAIAYAHSLESIHEVVLWGEGRAGARALLAAALAPSEVSRVLADVDRDLDAIESLADPELLPGALRFGGLGAFAGLCAPSELMLASREEPFAATKTCYAAAGVEDRLHAKPQSSVDQAAWLWAAR
jgi:hypothetical protein